MTKKKRREMRWTLTLSVMIAAVPLSVAFLGNMKKSLPSLPESFHLTGSKPAPKAPPATQPGKILPVLATSR
ncbi:MAG: hypothetical protein JNL72_01430 [Flavipsychrobacter sp.]|nr:hypothetical protein [Flavipsychrobacter sp.]